MLVPIVSLVTSVTFRLMIAIIVIHYIDQEDLGHVMWRAHCQLMMALILFNLLVLLCFAETASFWQLGSKLLQKLLA